MPPTTIICLKIMGFHVFYESVTNPRTDGRTDGPTDRRTDGPTDTTSHRDARTHQKRRRKRKRKIEEGEKAEIEQEKQNGTDQRRELIRILYAQYLHFYNCFIFDGDQNLISCLTISLLTMHLKIIINAGSNCKYFYCPELLCFIHYNVTMLQIYLIQSGSDFRFKFFVKFQLC